jgi:predicted PurR-regulated permease PerM
VVPQRSVRFQPRALLSVVAVLLGVAVLLIVLWISRRVITWVLIALFLALAINPAVEWLNRHHVPRRGAAVAVIYLGVLLVVLGIAAIFVPNLVRQISDFVSAVPGYVRDLTKGHGPLGFLETKYHVVERVQDAVKGGGSGGAAKVSTGLSAVVAAGRSVVEAIVATVTIIFLTLFMLLEGQAWTERVYGLVPPDQQDRWRRIGHSIYRTVGGYVSGNLLISFIAGLSYGIVLLVLGVPFPLALGFIVALLDLIPLAGATLAGVIVVAAAFVTGTTEGIIMAVFVVVYQQLENHILQPVIYGRTVQLSPLVVLIAILIGSQVAGVLGALGAIPVAGALQVILIDQLEHRRSQRAGAEPATETAGGEVSPQPGG